MFFFLFYGQIFFKKTPTFLKIQVKSFSECFYQKVKVCVCVCVRERVRWAVEISKCTSSEIGYASILQVYFLAYR